MPYLYTDNHNIKTGIVDLIDILKILFKNHNLKLNLKNESKDKVTLFIDEFSDFYEIKRLLKIKKDKKLKYILISTEFETNTNNGRSFNEFSENNKFENFFIKLFSTLLFFTPKEIRNYKIISKLIAFLLIPVLIPQFFFSKRLNFKFFINNIKDFRRKIYMNTRRKGFDKFLKHTDLLIKVHPLLNRNKKDFVLYPPIIYTQAPQNKKIKVSGTETNYRLYQCKKFKEDLKLKKSNYNFEFKSKIIFNPINYKKKFGFSYQPAQSRTWNKSNPIKIWRDFWIHKSIPIVDKKHNDHIIEKLTITKNMFFKNKINNEELFRNQLEYLRMSQNYNNDLFTKIKSLGEL